MRESKIQKDIIQWLESEGFYVIKVIQANKNGVPDIIFCKDGKFCAIEVKAKGGKVSGLQKVHIDMINSSGGKAIVAYDLWTVMEEF